MLGSAPVCPPLERASYRETAYEEQQMHGLGRTAKGVVLLEVKTGWADGYVRIASLRWPWQLERRSLERHRVSSEMVSSGQTRNMDAWLKIYHMYEHNR